MGTNMTIYIKAEQNVETTGQDVFVKDIGRLTCSDVHVLAKVKTIKLHHFYDKQGKYHADQSKKLRHSDRNTEQRVVISILKVISLIEECCPGVQVESVGETEILVEYIKPEKYEKVMQTFKLIFVAIISFFGTAFTIMAFHNDIGINRLFQKIYEMVMGRQGDGYGILELSYSVGLAVGIVLFFNHIGGRRITKDPTPIEVEMREYERAVNQALIETADREGKIIDV